MLRATGALLLVLGLFCCIHSLGVLWAPGGGLDLAYRWQENAYALRGKDPLFVHLHPERIDDDLGPVHPGAYPAWAVFTSLALFPPFDDFRWTLALYTLLTLAALVATMVYAASIARRARPGSPGAQLLLCGASLALFGNAVSLRLGQSGPLMSAILIACLITHDRRRDLASGLLLGVATFKPSISALFACPHLVRGRGRSIAAASLYFAVATGVMLAWTGSRPLEVLREWYTQSAAWDQGDSGVIGLLRASGLSRRLVTGAALGLGALVGLGLAFRFRTNSTLALSALLCVVGRLWMYHRRYDDTMLLFLLLALGALALRTGRRGPWGAFALVGLSLWAPLRLAWHTPPVIGLKLAAWGVGVLVLLLALGAGEDPDPGGADIQPG